jgi:cysteine desulfurase
MRMNYRPIYLDNHATTPVDPRIKSIVEQYMYECFGNPNSVEHIFGSEGQLAVIEAKQKIAELHNCSPNEIYFTSGATESINIAIQGFIRSISNKKDEKPLVIAVSPTEHKAVLETCQFLDKYGLARLVILKIDALGKIDIPNLIDVCSTEPTLLCVMAANNEIGTINDINNIGAIANKYGVPFFCDASQASGKMEINFRLSGITFLAISSHKMYGPKGVGALIIKNGTPLEPILFGGGQQGMIRPGTLNVSGIAGLGEACRLRYIEMEDDENTIRARRDKLQALLLEEFPNIKINGDMSNRLSGNLHISIPGILSSELITSLRSKVAVSSGSACSSNSSRYSHVLNAIGLTEEQIKSSIRIGVGKFNDNWEIETAADFIIESIKINSRLINSNILGR